MVNPTNNYKILNIFIYLRNAVALRLTLAPLSINHNPNMEIC